MFDASQIFLTGGSGLLGTELRRCIPGIMAPLEVEFDITDLARMEAYLSDKSIACFVHAAAFVSPPLIDKDPLRALDVNIAGTANVVRLCARHGLRLVYISTDYVFSGDKGDYGEEDPVHPVNKYAWSKLGGECAVRLYDNSLIVRTTFGPNTFPYSKAFVDQWTSRESVARIAELIACAILSDATGVLHVGGTRKTVYDYAKDLDPARNIEPLRRDEVGFAVPRDTSLNTDRYKKLFGKGS